LERSLHFPNGISLAISLRSSLRVQSLSFLLAVFEPDPGQKGHETTAYSLASALALLSIYPDEQEELYKHIRSVVPDGRLPVLTSPGQIFYAMLTNFHRPIKMFRTLLELLLSSQRRCVSIHLYAEAKECIRMLLTISTHQVSLVLKEASEDCVIPTNTGESLLVPKGTGLVPMIEAVHHNGTWMTTISWLCL
jgi:cytochrome P450